MKKIILAVIIILLLLACGAAAPASAVILSDAGLGFASGQTMSVQVWDASTIALIVNGTSGVVEHPWGNGKSSYTVTWSGTPGDRYSIYFSSSNGQTGYDALSEAQTLAADISGPVATQAQVTALGNPMQASSWVPPANTEIGLINSVAAKIRFDASNAVFANSPAGSGGVSNAPTVQQIDTQLSGTHGGGAWGAAASIVLPPVNGQVYTATATQYVPVKVYAGDTPTITFNLGTSYTGWTPEFAAKTSPASATYAMAVRDATWVNASAGQGTIALTATDTATPGIYRGELKLINGTQTLTAIEFVIQVLPAVIQ